MTGFLVTNIEPASGESQRIISRCGQIQSWFQAHASRGYSPDSTIVDTVDHYAVLHGVVLSAREFDATTEDLSTVIATAITSGNPRQIGRLQGSFCGAAYDRRTSDWLAYTNQLGDRPVYYFHNGSSWAFGTNMSELTQLLKRIGLGGHADREALLSLLTYGFLQPGQTINSAVRRLLPGEAIRVGTDGSVERLRYHEMVRPPMLDISMTEASDQLDRLFRTAVQEEFEHDRKNGREHLADLSGGMDARMVSWVARDIGYKPFTNLTYSQSGFIGLEISQELARRMGNHLITGLLDDARFLLDIDATVLENHGSALYPGITGGRRMLAALNWNHFGLEHTGQLGDVIVGGSYLRAPEYDPPSTPAGLYSTMLSHKLQQPSPANYGDHELYLLNVRGLSGILSTHITRQNYTCAVSPFLNLDVLDFCLSLPADLRWQNRLYKEWVINSYREAASIRNDNTGAPFSAGRLRTYTNRARRALPHRIAKAVPSAGRLARNASMNPFDYWFAENPTLLSHLENYMSENLDNIAIDQESREDISSLFYAGGAIEKTMALTAVAACRHFT